MKRCSDSNGISSMRGMAAASSAASSPALSASVSSAPSVGSPTSCQPRLRACFSWASLHSRAQRGQRLQFAVAHAASTAAPSTLKAALGCVAGAAHVERTRGQHDPHRGHLVAWSACRSCPSRSPSPSPASRPPAGAARWRCCAAMTRVPMASTMVTIAGRPSGIAATASPTTARKISSSRHARARNSRRRR